MLNQAIVFSKANILFACVCCRSPRDFREPYILCSPTFGVSDCRCWKWPSDDTLFHPRSRRIWQAYSTMIVCRSTPMLRDPGSRSEVRLACAAYRDLNWQVLFYCIRGRYLGMLCSVSVSPLLFQRFLVSIYSHKL